MSVTEKCSVFFAVLFWGFLSGTDRMLKYYVHEFRLERGIIAHKTLDLNYASARQKNFFKSEDLRQKKLNLTQQ